ncbi:FtsX-like permease family protein [Corynebacterium breve]|uniref:FtsX-like permease family protein n=1 Tax=Corynebacterium breve TaxID=3049799 RepID=A0ABY8VDV9_9CORY|nr:FtsX-like permease family protein [Corynebacterium breve]WIM67282.1 FtsX-like permease family protein [Corynebacterium breve]
MDNILVFLSWKNIKSNVTRLILSVIAVVLGTSFVAGGFILTASLSKAFDEILKAGYEGVDVTVSSEGPVPLVRGEILPELEQMKEVAKVEALDQQSIVLIVDDEPVQTGGAGAWVIPYVGANERVGFLDERIVDGHEPTQPNHATLNSSTAEQYGVGVGDKVEIIDREGRREITIDAISEMGMSVGDWAGIQIPASQYWREFAVGDTASSFSLKAAEGTTAEELATQVQSKLPDTQVRTGEAAMKEESKGLRKQLSFVSYIMLGFGLIALLVGTFIISNTFSMIVAQRTRDFALLRALGLSRKQLTGSVVMEAAIIGLVGSFFGILLGMGLVAAIVWGIEQGGLGFPNAGIGLDWKSTVIPILVGVGVTIWGAWAPARRAGSIRPVEAMRSGDQSTAQPLKARSLTGVLLFLVGLALTSAALLVDDTTAVRASLLGAGAVGLVLGWWLLSAWVVRAVFSKSPPTKNAVVTLAGTNLARNPRRTASTAFALMLGVTLVSTVGILGATMKNSVFGAIDQYLIADAVVSTGYMPNQEYPKGALEDIEAMDEVAGTLTTTWAPVTVNGKGATSDGTNQVTTVAESDPTVALAIEVTGGSFEDLAAKPGVGMRTSYAEEQGVKIGDMVQAESPMHPEPISVPLVVTWDDESTYTSMSVSAATVRELVPEESMWMRQQTYVTFNDGVDTQAALNKLKDTVSPYEVLQVMDRAEFREGGATQVNGLLAIVYALLALSVIIAVLGIINTLALSITERRHEFGMLRAVGMQRGQMRRMITLESAGIALLGAFAGTGLGVWLGYVFVSVLSDDGLDRLLIPWGQLAILVAGALVVGMIAAIAPAQKAARTHPLAAVE